MTSPETVSLHMLRRYHFNELPPEERAKLEVALEQDAGARARLAKMRAAEEAFLAKADVAAESVAILEKLDQPAREPSAIRRWLTGRPLQLAAAFLLLVALVPLGK